MNQVVNELLRKYCYRDGQKKQATQMIEIFQPIYDYVLTNVLLTSLYACVMTIKNFCLSTARFSTPFLIISITVAYLLYRKKSSQSAEPITFWEGFIKLRSVYLHPSARIDYIWLFVSRIVQYTILIPIFALLFVPLMAFSSILTDLYVSLLGPINHMRSAGVGDLLFYGFLLIFSHDLGHYWVHRWFHTIPVLWEFHKVHHSAQVLVPPTAVRVHPVEKIVGRFVSTVINILLISIVLYVYGDEITPMQIFGTNYAVVVSNSLSSNLRHTHIWFSFGPYLEYILSSPAQHQIHHSNDQRHFDKNFTVHFSFWDWMFGTLYRTSSKQENITFGIGEEENKNYYSVWANMAYPFKASSALITKRFKKPEIQPDHIKG